MHEEKRKLSREIGRGRIGRMKGKEGSMRIVEVDE